MLPVDVATDQTLKFVEKNCTLSGASVLEVGCGSGHLAKAMQDKGAKVVAIDLSEKAVEEARAKGVVAVIADFLEYSALGLFDAIVFSRSLHHIHPVKTAVERAHQMLKPNGFVLVDDFSVDMVDDKSLAWLRGQDESLPLSMRNPHEHGHKFPVGSVEEWNEHHMGKHKVADTGELIDSMKWSFSNVRFESAPYLYLYMMDRIIPTPEGGERTQAVLELERKGIADRQIRGIGLRLIGVKD